MSTEVLKPTVSDVELMIAAAQTGSNEAVGQLSEAYRDYLTLVCQLELGSDVQAKCGVSDVVQETFLDVQRHIGQFRGSSQSEFVAWLRQILKGKLAAVGRRFRLASKRQVHREVPLDYLDQDQHGECKFLVDSQTPSRNAIASEEDLDIQRALDELPEHYRRIIILRNLELRSFEDIGRAMDRTADAARMLWLRALQQLKTNATEQHAERSG